MNKKASRLKSAILLEQEEEEDNLKEENDEEEDIRLTLSKTLNKIENCEDDLQNVNLEIIKLESLLNQLYNENIDEKHSLYKKFLGLHLENLTHKKFKRFFYDYLETKYNITKNQEILKIKKLAIYAVTIEYFTEDPTRIEEKLISQIKKYCVTISILGQSTLESVHNLATDFWNLNKSDFLLTDIRFCPMTLIMDTPVHLFVDQEKEHIDSSHLFLVPKNLKNIALLDSQRESCILKEPVEEKKEEVSNEGLDNTNRILGLLEKSKPALSHYKIKRSDHRFSHHVFRRVFFIIYTTVLVAFSLVCAYNVIDFPVTYNIKKSLKKTYYSSPPFVLSDIYDFIDNFDFFKETQRGLVLNSYSQYVIGKFRILQARTKSHPCIKSSVFQNKTNKTCFYTTYDSNTRNTSQYGENSKFSEEWQFFKTKESTKMSTITGLIGNYDGSGYLVDLDPYINKTQLKNMTTIMKNLSFIDGGTRMVQISCLIFDVIRHYFISMKVRLEADSDGIVYPYYDCEIFKLLYPDTDEYNIAFPQDASLLAIVLLYGVLDTLNEIYSQKKVDGKRSYAYLKSFGFLYMVIIAVLSGLSFYFTFLVPSEKNLQQLLAEKKFLDLDYYAFTFQFGVKIKGAMAFLLGIKGMRYLVAFKNIFLLFELLKNAAKNFVLVFFILLVFYISIGIGFYYYYGLLSSNFNDIFQAITSIYVILNLKDLHTAKDIKIKEDGDDVIKVLLIALILFLLYGAHSLFFSIIADSFRNMTLIENFFEGGSVLIQKIGGVFTKCARLFKKSKGPEKPSKAGL